MLQYVLICINQKKRSILLSSRSTVYKLQVCSRLKQQYYSSDSLKAGKIEANLLSFHKQTNMSSVKPNDNVAVRDDSKSIPVLEAINSTVPISTDTTNFDLNSANWFQKRRLTFPIDRTCRLSASLERQFNSVAIGAGQIEYQIGVVAEQTSTKAKDVLTKVISYKPVSSFLSHIT